ncbi:MAG: hypothetical protein R2794_03140 [Chitinophagales bacterium]
MHVKKLPFTGQLIYASGMLGLVILMNMIGCTVVYFYDPLSNSNIPYLLPRVTVLGIFSFISLIAASGRIWDIVTDPVVAFARRRRSKNPVVGERLSCAGVFSPFCSQAF